MNEKDVRAISLILQWIREDTVLDVGFEKLLFAYNFPNLKRLEKQFKNLVKMLDNPMYTGTEILVPIKQNLEIIKIEEKNER